MNKTCRDIIALTFVPGLTRGGIISLVERFGDTDEIFNISKTDLENILEKKFEDIEKIRSARSSREYTEELEYIKKEKIKVTCCKDEDYPSPLKDIYDMPAVLYYKGDLREPDINAVAIVGARMCSIYGRRMAESLAHDLAERGITVVSGMARGIDQAAHEGALKAKGRTIAVIGSGFKNIYPGGSERLVESIINSGAVLTEYSSGIEPSKFSFPNRNRIISGLAKGVVVVEAAQKSGSLITADFALNEGKEVFAVPGAADSYVSKGTNRLIQNGAKLTTSVDDILEELRLEGIKEVSLREAKDDDELLKPVPDKTKEAPQSQEEAKILTFLKENGAMHVNDILEGTDINIGKLAAVLLGLEMKGFVKALAGERYRLK